MLLARYALFDKGVAVCLHGWPKVAGAEDSGGHGSRVRVIFAYTFMQFFYYVLSLFGCDTFEEWLAVSPVKIPFWSQFS